MKKNQLLNLLQKTEENSEKICKKERLAREPETSKGSEEVTLLDKSMNTHPGGIIMEGPKWNFLLVRAARQDEVGWGQGGSLHFLVVV